MLALSLCLCWQREALAFTILSVRDFSQSAGLTFSGHRSTSSAMGSGVDTEVVYTEDYSTGFEFSLLSPQLLKGNTVLNLEWLQDSSHSSSGDTENSQFQLRYSLTGNILSRKPYPISFSSTSSRETVSPPFSPTYQSESETFSVRANMMNDYIPSDFSYSQQSQRTSGLQSDTTQKSHSLSFGALPTLGDYGSLSLGVNLSESDASADLDNRSHSTTASANAGYHNSWKSAQNLNRGVSLVYAYQKSAGETALNQQNLNGGVNWQMGKVLESGLGYYTSKSNSGEQTTQSKGATGMLSHRLMGSLSTGLALSAAEEEHEGGESNSYSGAVSLSYRKKLPDSGSVNMNYSYGMNREERTGTVAEVDVLGERHAIPVGVLPRIRLKVLNFQPESLEVVGAQTLLPYPASFYNILPDGIELVDSYALDTELLISYRFRQDPSVSTVGTTHGVGAALSLRGDKYRLYANAKISDQKVVAGEATQLTVSGSRRYDMGFNANLGRHTAGGEVGYEEDYAQDLYYMNGSWGYSTPFARGNLSLSVNERYTWQSSQQQEGGSWANSLSLQSGYNRNFRFVASKFKANYANATVQGGSMFHSAMLSANLEAKLGRLSALFNSNATWSFSDSGSSSSQGVSIALRRSF